MARLVELWHRAAPIRDEWLAVAHSTGPADRAGTEHLIAGIYHRLRRRAPVFRWVQSPRQALPLLTRMPTHRDLQSWVLARRPHGAPPVASDIATALARLRGALDDAAAHPDLTVAAKPPQKEDRHKPWPVLPPERALEAGVPLREVLRQSLHAPIAADLTWPVRSAIGAQGTLPVCWYGQQDATWIGLYDLLPKLGLARYRTSDAAELDGWAALARAAGWWWPGEDVCVLVERPALIGARRVGYRDGTTVTW
ncbi:hypothetical protein Daura_32885 [Dactylosporangium aurantiacum]|uniref:DUF6745 domain-containing protein n=1 Tax=Dactylosporangium aurantiacum TaxID=35754 RepID=A0A9Q9I872_9ACTN|nr:hypothetical protein [Dactylosporangium aurantiacum]MDG6104988.1 hypothetical protein [Dactylosporangium aurantiacum]UWZ51524.1 hypothetical protein Daura_32885 [Dactylosporangium aurantiacum]